MKEIKEINGKGEAADMLRWGWILLAAVLAAVLALTLETGSVFAQANSAFTFVEARVRVITPNGDQKNDLAILCFDNPKASGVSGEVYNLRGRKVAEMTFVANAGGATLGCPVINPGLVAAEALTWDGRASGSVVRSGVYVYVIKAEDKAVTGTVLVVR